MTSPVYLVHNKMQQPYQFGEEIRVLIQESGLFSLLPKKP